MKSLLCGLVLASAACAGTAGPPGGAPAPAASAPSAGFGYQLGVSSESGDIITWIRPSANALTVDRVVPIGIMPADIDGPHNLTMAPDQASYYVSIAHGTPNGTLWRLA